MKAGWITTELGKICAFENGDRGTNYPSRSVRTSEGIPFINAGHLTDNGLDYSTMDYIPRERFDLLGGGKVRSGDILFCLRGSLGKFASVGELNEGAIASSLVILRPSQHLLPSFLLLYLDSALCSSMIEQYGNGAAQPNLSSGSLKKFRIPLPPLPEQQRIVTLLDEAFDGIATARAHAEKNLQNARAIFESHLQSVFAQWGDGWTEKRLADVTTIINGFAFKSGDFSSHAKVQSIKITNVGVGEFVCESDSLLPTNFLETYASFSIKAGSIVIALTRTIISGGLKVAIVPEEFDGALLNQRVAAIHVSPNLLNAEFLFAYLSSQYVFDYVKAHVNTLMQPNLSINDLRAMPIPLPPAIEQARIAARLEVLKDETKSLESIYLQKLTALDELKNSLLHRAFNGDL